MSDTAHVGVRSVSSPDVCSEAIDRRFSTVSLYWSAAVCSTGMEECSITQSASIDHNGQFSELFKMFIREKMNSSLVDSGIIEYSTDTKVSLNGKQFSEWETKSDSGCNLEGILDSIHTGKPTDEKNIPSINR